MQTVNRTPEATSEPRPAQAPRKPRSGVTPASAGAAEAKAREAAQTAAAARKRFDAQKKAAKDPATVAVRALLASPAAPALRAVPFKVRATKGAVSVEVRKVYAPATDETTGRAEPVAVGEQKHYRTGYTLHTAHREGVSASYGNRTGAGADSEAATRELARQWGYGDIVRGCEAIARDYSARKGR